MNLRLFLVVMLAFELCAAHAHGATLFEIVSKAEDPDDDPLRTNAPGPALGRIPPEPKSNVNDTGFRTYAALLQSMENLSPTLRKTFVIGTTVLGEKIKAYRISTTSEFREDANGSGRKPQVLITAGVHPREWYAPEAAARLAAKLVADHNAGSSLLKKAEIWIVPVVNVDGFLFSQAHHDAYWGLGPVDTQRMQLDPGDTRRDGRLLRKNMRGHPKWTTTFQDAYLEGVNLNRNFDSIVFNQGSPEDCGDTNNINVYDDDYNGGLSARASEPETRAIQNLWAGSSPLLAFLRGSADLHAFHQNVFYPGNVPQPTLGRIIEAVGVTVVGLNKDVQPAKKYGAQACGSVGAVDDYFAWVSKVPAFTIEISPTKLEGGGVLGFVQDEGNVVPVTNQVITGLKDFARWTANDPFAREIQIKQDQDEDGTVEKTLYHSRVDSQPQERSRVEVAKPQFAKLGKVEVKVIFSQSMKTAGQPVVRLVQGQHVLVVTPKGPGWSTTSQMNDTWEGEAAALSGFEDREVVLSVDALDEFNKRLDAKPLTVRGWSNEDGDWSSYEDENGQGSDGGKDVSGRISISRFPPRLTLSNEHRKGMHHGAYSDSAIITSTAMHNPAPVKSLEFFIGDNPNPSEIVRTLPDQIDILGLVRQFEPNSWHYVRACDVTSECVYSLFGVFPPGVTPPNPPGPPPACAGCTQRPNPRPGQPFPPADDPNNPPPVPTPSQPSPPEPPTQQNCKGEGCLDEPPAPEAPWVLKPRRPKFCDSPRNCLIPVAFPHDPNAKHGPAGSVTPGQLMTYTIEFENEGEGLALETFVRDTLDTALDATTLVLRDMRRVNYLTEAQTPATFPWSYDSRTRTVTVLTGDADFRQGGRFILEARLKSDTTPGTMITNQAVVYFPNSLEVTPTNVIVSAVPLPTQLAYEGASSTAFLTPTRVAARLTAAGRPLVEQPVEFILAGSSWIVLTDGSGLASISTAIAALPGTYNLQARFAGDGLLYSSRETSVGLMVAPKPALLEAPFAAARSGEVAHYSISFTDDERRPLIAQSDDPKTVHLELLRNDGGVTPLASTLLSGTSISFEVPLPQPLQIAWSIRARFDGDMRYAAAISTGILRLIDQTPPTITILSPVSGRTYSSSQLIPIDFSVQDSEDPAPAAVAVLISSAGLSVPVSNDDAIAASYLSPGQWSLAVEAVDWGGNQAVAQGAAFQVLAEPDVLAPRTNMNIGLPQAGSDPLYITSTTLVGFTAADDLTTLGDGIGVGVERTEYALDGGTATRFAGELTVSTEGAHNLVFFSADYAGNVEAAQTRALFVDGTPPLTRLLIVGLPASTTDVSFAPADALSFSAEDSGSGAAVTYYAVDGATGSSVFASTFTLSIGTHSLTFHSVDNLGNAEAVQRILLTVRPSDSTAPLLSLDYPSPAGAGVEQAVGAAVQVRGRVSDEHDLSWTLETAPGVAASSGFVPIAAGAGDASGILASWNTAALSGYQTLRLSATDAFGNASSTSASVFVGSPVFSFAVGRKDSHVILNKIKGPTGIAVRSDGAIWVASAENNSIILLSPAGVLLGTAGRAPGHSGEDNEHGKKDKDHDDEDDDDEDAGGLRFKNLQGLALDAADNLYTADRDLNRVVKLSRDGQVLLLKLGKTDGKGRPKSGSGPGELRHPFDVAVDGNGDIYVADSGNRRIQVFNSSGTVLRQFGPGVLLSTSQVRGIALTAEGLWVSDKEAERVFLFSRAGTLLKSIGDADSVVGEISRTRGLAADRLGALYVVEPNRDRAQKFDPQGKGLLAFGNKAGLSHADKHAKRYLILPIDAALAPDGSIWITDTGRDRIVRYALPVPGGYGVAAYSAGGGAGLSVEPARRVVDHKDGATVSRDDGAGVQVPEGALAADLEVTVDKGDENLDKEQKTAKRREMKIAAVSEEVQYGPEGTTFSTPVTLTLPYDANLIATQGIKEDELKVYYWNPTLKDWQAMTSTVDKLSRTVNAQTTHFSGYQVQGPGGGIGVAAAAIDEFGLRDGYVFPNPSRGGAAVVFRIQPGLADSVEVRVYDLSGRKVHSSSNFRLSVLDDGNGKGNQNTYDHAWDVSGIGSGVYTFVITAKKAGQKDIRKTGKAGIVK